MSTWKLNKTRCETFSWFLFFFQSRYFNFEDCHQPIRVNEAFYDFIYAFVPSLIIHISNFYLIIFMVKWEFLWTPWETVDEKKNESGRKKWKKRKEDDFMFIALWCLFDIIHDGINGRENEDERERIIFLFNSKPTRSFVFFFSDKPLSQTAMRTT